MGVSDWGNNPHLNERLALDVQTSISSFNSGEVLQHTMEDRIEEELNITQKLQSFSNLIGSSNNIDGHLTSKSDVYSFGVVLLEMMTGRRSMDRNRPNGEHSLVEWARPYLEERARFYCLIDPLLEGNFSIKGAQKAAHLAHRCLSRDPKVRPLMSEVVEALKPLINLKDMASSSPLFQNMQAERAFSLSSSQNARNGFKSHDSFARNGQLPVRSLSNCYNALPQTHQSSKPNSRHK